MQEIKTRQVSTLPRIVGPQISIQDAIQKCIHEDCIIMVIVNNNESLPSWLQLASVVSEKEVHVSEIYYNGHIEHYDNFYHAWIDYTPYTFISEMTHHLPKSEFYLIETLNDVFTVTERNDCIIKEIQKYKPAWS
jgi:hypothetical protein